MVKVGCVTLDTSHPKSFAFRMTDEAMAMGYTHVWDKNFRSQDEVQWFANKYNLEICDDLADMAQKVDIGFIQTTNWEKRLDWAKPFIEAGKPVFMDKPMVGSVKDVAKVRELVAKGAKILGSSSVRYCEEIQNFLKEPVETRGEILSIFGTAGNNEFDYCVHIVEAFSALAGAKAVSGKFVGVSETKDGKSCQVHSIKFENGIIATYYSAIGRWSPFHITVMTTKQTRSFVIDTLRIYQPMLREICKEISTGKSKLADVEPILNCTEAMLCCKKSRDEMNGAEVTIDQLGENDKFDGYAHEADYAAAAGKIYKD